ncbi:hypothetical protein BB780_04835 [Stenotrophomonas maltophilia]|nr:hypothetical protein BB780_04835 [Stenotrophomonas maltophilia]
MPFSWRQEFLGIISRWQYVHTLHASFYEITTTICCFLMCLSLSVKKMIQMPRSALTCLRIFLRVVSTKGRETLLGSLRTMKALLTLSIPLMRCCGM